MSRHMRLGAAVSIAALGASMATPALDSALASNPTAPTLPNISAALQAAGVSSSSASSILSELSTLQSNPGSLGLGGLSSLDNALSTINGGLVGSILTSVTTLLLSLTPAAPAQLGTVLADLSSIGSAPGASSAVTQAVAELTAALSTAGLGQLLTQLSGIDNAGALSQLAALQSLAPGANSGSLTSVAGVLSALSTAAGGNSSLTGAAALLNAGSVSPTTLQSAITQLQGAQGTLGSAGLNNLLSSLTGQLQQSGSLFGQLASVGNAASPTSGLSSLAALPGLTPGASISSGSLAPIANLLTTVAGEPGVSGTPVASTLATVASTLSGSPSPSDLLGAIATLQSSTGSLPAPLNALVSNLASGLGGSESIFGLLPGLSPTQVTSALSSLSSLPSLGAGTTIPAGGLTSVGALLTQLAAQPGVSGTPAAGVLGQLASVLGGAVTPSALSGVIAYLQALEAQLPSPLNTVAGQLTSSLQKSGNLASTGTQVGGTGTGGTGTGGTGTGGTGTGGTGTGGTGTGSTGTGTGAKTGSRPFAWGIASHVKRSGDSVSMLVYCLASAGQSCSTSVNASERGHRSVRRSVHVAAGHTQRVSFKLKSVAGKKRHAHKRAAIKLNVRSGAYRLAKTLK